MDQPKRFKIHSLKTATHTRKADNGVFYADETEALNKAARYVQDNGEAMAVYELRYVLRARKSPVSIEDVRNGTKGLVVPDGQ